MSRQFCASTFWNMLYILEDSMDPRDATVYARELMKTPQCYRFHDMAGLRNTLLKEAGDSLQNAQNYTDTAYDREQLFKSVRRHRQLHRSTLQYSLSKKDKAYYYTIHQHSMCIRQMFAKRTHG